MPTDLSGGVQMDFNADRISDFMVHYLSEKTRKFEDYMLIKLSAASSNVTDCMPWMVRYRHIYLFILNLETKYNAKAIGTYRHHSTYKSDM